VAEFLCGLEVANAIVLPQRDYVTARLITEVRARSSAVSFYVVATDAVEMHVQPRLAYLGADRLVDGRSRESLVALAGLVSRHVARSDSGEGLPGLGLPGLDPTWNVVWWCRRNGMERFTVGHVAAWFGEIRETISRRVSRLTGRAAGEWLLEGRVRYARALIAGGYTKTAAAVLMGYAGASSIWRAVSDRADLGQTSRRVK
jgi:hypothetical protein